MGKSVLRLAYKKSVCVWCVSVCVCVLAGETVSGGGSGREGLL